MSELLVAYASGSTDDQDLTAQQDALIALGMAVPLFLNQVTEASTGRRVAGGISSTARHPEVA